MDHADRFVADLTRDDFQIFEHGTEQHISSFSLEDAPMSVAIVLDLSGSMKRVLPAAHEALRTFLSGANTEDEFCAVAVSDHPQVIAGLGRDPDALLASTRTAVAHGRTALLDSVYLAAHLLQKGSHPRKVLLVISDGNDNHSRYTESEVLDLLRESEATVYAFGVGIEPRSAFESSEQDAPDGKDLLTELAEETGGAYFDADNAKELSATFGRLDIRYQYVLGFTPAPRCSDGKYHRVDLHLSKRAKGRRLNAHWRPGYYAPSQQP